MSWIFGAYIASGIAVLVAAAVGKVRDRRALRTPDPEPTAEEASS